MVSGRPLHPSTATKHTLANERQIVPKRDAASGAERPWNTQRAAAASAWLTINFILDRQPVPATSTGSLRQLQEERKDVIDFRRVRHGWFERPGSDLHLLGDSA